MQTGLKFPQLATTSLSDYEKCSICLHCRSAPSPPLWPWATHELSRADQNPWPTVPPPEETDVGNISRSLSFSVACTRNKLAETAYRADVQTTGVSAHTAASWATDGPFTVSVCGSWSSIRTVLLLRCQGISMFEKGHSTCLGYLLAVAFFFLIWKSYVSVQNCFKRCLCRVWAKCVWHEWVVFSI